MRYGDIEGKGKVYDSDGVLIPNKNECILSTFDGYVEKVEKRIHLKWRPEFYDGMGIFILTDERLVFLRDPILYEKKFKFSGKRFATLADWEYWTNRSNKAIEACAKEFIQIPYKEIEKVEKGKTLSRIFVASQENKYRVVTDSKVGTELIKLQDKDK